MPTKTQTDAVLRLMLNTGTGTPVDFACQLSAASFTQPGPGSVESVKVACGGDPVVVASGQTSPGSITGTVFKDFSAAGISTLLAQAVEQAATTGTVDLTYTYTENPGTDHEVSWTGKATVDPFEIPFTPGELGTHELNLPVLTATGTYKTTP